LIHCQNKILKGNKPELRGGECSPRPLKETLAEEFHITLAANAQPFCVHTPWTITFAYHNKLQAELDLLESQHIITSVIEATTWCAPIVVTPKNSDKIRMCVGLSHLNRFVIHEQYQSPTPVQAVVNIAASKVKIFTILDALKGYHQYP